LTAVPTFKSVEHAGWNERAAVYDDITAIITNYGIVPLLDAAGIAAGQTVLDVCCGTGLVAALAMERGAAVTAIDIAADMITAARAKGIDRRGGARAAVRRTLCLHHLVRPRGVAHAQNHT
jgi:2-polyprenyl-3-methyl-5-hydroxy-6-metoxy-1,4-benzoquinol methylase